VRAETKKSVYKKMGKLKARKENGGKLWEIDKQRPDITGSQ